MLRKRISTWAAILPPILTLVLLVGMSAEHLANSYSNQPQGSVVCVPKFVSHLVDAGFKDQAGIALIDLDRDGLLDIVVAAHHHSVLSILYGMGQGQFEPPVLVCLLPDDCLSSEHHHNFAATDLNGDGWPDLAIPSRRGFVILLNRGAREFEPPFRMRGKGVDAKAGDFNEDGLPDLAMAIETKAVRVFLNLGGGVFAAPVRFQAGLLPKTLALGDFNEDGHLDIVTANKNSDDVTVLLGNGNGKFAPGTPFPTGRTNPRSVRTADFDGDGHLDLVVSHQFQDDGSLENFVFLRGDGRGNFRALGAFPTGKVTRGLTVGDFNADGVLDVAVANLKPNSVSLLLGSRELQFTFLTTPAIEAHNPRELDVGDVDGDGRLDIVASTNKGRTTVTLLLNQGCGLGSASSVMAGY